MESNNEMEMKHTIIIAEAGVNHNGSVEIAKQLVDRGSSAEAGNREIC